MPRKIALNQYLAELRAQQVPREHLACVCPVCKTVQSMQSLIDAGNEQDDVERYFGTACVGRFTNAGPFTTWSVAGRGCDWALYGLLHLHELEVIDPKDHSKVHMRFEVATPEQAQRLMRERATFAAELADEPARA